MSFGKRSSFPFVNIIIWMLLQIKYSIGLNIKINCNNLKRILKHQSTQESSSAKKIVKHFFYRKVLCYLLVGQLSRYTLRIPEARGIARGLTANRWNRRAARATEEQFRRWERGGRSAW